MINGLKFEEKYFQKWIWKKIEIGVYDTLSLIRSEFFYIFVRSRRINREGI